MPNFYVVIVEFKDNKSSQNAFEELPEVKNRVAVIRLIARSIYCGLRHNFGVCTLPSNK